MLAVRWLSPDASLEASLVIRVTDVVNRAYEPAGDGLWSAPLRRTTLEGTREAIAGGTVAIVEIDGEIVGAVQSQRDGAAAWFGVLAVDPSHAGRGVGTALVTFAEDEARAGGARTMELEVLSADPPLAHLERLAAWYTRRGYREVSRTRLASAPTSARPALIVACDAVLMRRFLSAPADPRAAGEPMG